MSDDVEQNQRDQKVIYEQRCDDFRSLNGFLWQSPLIIMTLTGGLWFAVASFDISNRARSMLLIFAVIANVLMIIAFIRLRYVMQSILKDIRAYDGKKKIGGNFMIVGCFCTLLAVSAIGSFVASCHPEAYFTKGAEIAKTCPPKPGG
jgi:hypothetical protein